MSTSLMAYYYTQVIGIELIHELASLNYSSAVISCLGQILRSYQDLLIFAGNAHSMS